MAVKTAGPARKATPKEVLDFLRDHNAPIATAKDVKNEFGVTRAAANSWLDELEESGKINSQRVGASAIVYWVA